MVGKAKDPDDIEPVPRNGPAESDEEPEEPDEGSETDRGPEAFYVWKNEGGAHLPGD